MDKVLETTDQIMLRLQMSCIANTSPVNQELSKLLRLCIDFYNNILTVLELKNFGNLLQRFDYNSRKSLALYMALNILENETIIPDAENVDSVLNIISPLIQDQEDQPQDAVLDMEDFAEEQSIVGRIVHLLKSNDLDAQYKILVVARKHFGAGGAQRIKFVLSSLVFQAYQLAHKFKSIAEKDELWVKKCEKIIQFCHTTIAVLAKNDLPELALRLYLKGALCISRVGGFENYETVAYDFMTQAFSIYEDEISDSKSQLAAITLIMSTFEQITNFGEENAEPLRTNCALAASKLLKKPDQCRGVAACSALFWTGKKEGVEMKDEKRTLDCLKRALRIASQCLDSGLLIQLHIEILNYCVLFYEKGNTLITVSLLNQLITKIFVEMAKLDGPDESKQIKTQFDNTLCHIKYRMAVQDANLAVSFEGLNLEHKTI